MVTGQPAHSGFDPALSGRKAECDGGGPLPGTRTATRQEFAGTLTGEYVDHGEPPWRWYLMESLTGSPEGYPYDTVWCLAGNVFVAGQPNTVIPGTEK